MVCPSVVRCSQSYTLASVDREVMTHRADGATALTFIRCRCKNPRSSAAKAGGTFVKLEKSILSLQNLLFVYARARGRVCVCVCV